MKGKAQTGFMTFGQYLYYATFDIRKLEERTDLPGIRKIRRTTIGFYFAAIPFAAVCWILYTLYIPAAASFGIKLLFGTLSILLPYLLSLLCSLPVHRKIYKRLRANFEAMQFMFGKTEDVE